MKLKNYEEYNKNPNKCLNCGKPIYCEENQILHNIKLKKFCNSSCSASYNNKGKVKNPYGGHAKSQPDNKLINNFLDNFTDEEILDFYNSSSTLKEFSKKVGYSHAIDRRCKSVEQRLNSIEIDLDKFSYSDKIGKYIRNKRKCNICGKFITDTNKSGLCQTCYREKNNEKIIENWLKTGDTGCAIGSNLRNCIREYIYKIQNYSCSICGMNTTWNKKEIKFILDHINGDASNNHIENLRLICPNCDSQLDTYKSKNKNSARNFRHKYYQINQDNHAV